MLDVKNLSVTLGGARILEDVSFTAREGQWLMILGPNGAGKSTIVNAISGGVPYTGEVRLDGENVRRMKPRVRARKLGVLSQKHHVSYAFTVEEIVRMGRYAHARGLFSPRSVEDEAHFLDAVEKTGLSGFLNQSVLTVSGGEMQRLSIARAFLKNAPVLILDEATAFADPDNEKLVQLAFEKLSKNKTVIMIAHRLSTITNADCIYVLKDGKIAESGAHTSLLAENGIYTHMWTEYNKSVNWQVGKAGA